MAAESAATVAGKTLYLIDGNAMIHRAFHAVPESFETKAGEKTNAIYGFAGMMFRIIREQRPDYLIMTFDPPTPTFRHIDYQLYKAQRPPMPDHLRSQISRVREFVAAMNIPIFEVDGFEADDVLGALSLQATELGLQTTIVTGDMDTMQLVTPNVRIMTARKSMSDIVYYTNATVEERFGVPPKLIPDWKGLKGDTSDNIPGVPGIGEKTATKLLQTYGTLEDVLAHAEELPGRQKQLLTDFADQARKSKWLATIATDVPVTLDLAACHTHDFNREHVLALFRELEFNSLIRELPRQPSEEQPVIQGTASLEDGGPPLHTRSYTLQPAIIATGPAQMDLFAAEELPPVQEIPMPVIDIVTDPDTHTTVVTDVAMLDVLVHSLAHAKRFSFDTETDSVDEMRAQLVGISLSMGQAEAYYIPVGHTAAAVGDDQPTQLSIEQVRTALAPLFADPSIEKVAHNAKFDCTILERFGIPVAGLTFDTMIAAYLIDPGRRGLGLKDQAFEVLGKVMTPITELIGTGARQITMARVPVRVAAIYAGSDADMTFRLVAPLEAKLREIGVADIFTSIEMPLVQVLAEMEQTGILVDLEMLDRMSIDLAEQIAKLEQEVYATVGHQFNINSNKQLGDILFTELQLPTGRKTKTGYSVDVEVLENLRGSHPAVDHLLEYRTLMKLKSTYVDGVRELLGPDGRVHTSFNQTVATSGRLSSSNPNLQNIPVRTEVGRQIRRAFIASPGHQLLAADYSQVELRILAHITHEPSLVEAFAANEDIHRVTGSRLYGITPAEVTKDQRRMAKTVTFAIIYGQSAFGLSRTANMTQEEARQFIKAFEESFPKVKEYVRSTIQKVRTEGYVQTLLGRKRFIPNLMSMPVPQRQAAEREAINMPIQGTNADIIKLAMIGLNKAIHNLQLQSRMILQVHDELVLEVPDNEIDVATRLVKAEMEGAMQLSVPLRVEMNLGRDWYNTEPID